MAFAAEELRKQLGRVRGAAGQRGRGLGWRGSAGSTALGSLPGERGRFTGPP